MRWYPEFTDCIREMKDRGIDDAQYAYSILCRWCRINDFDAPSWDVFYTKWNKL